MRSKRDSLSPVRVSDLKPARGRELVERFAHAFGRRGIDPDLVREDQGNITGVYAEGGICFTYGRDLLYVGDIVPMKALRRGKKSKGA